jgi:hypothetical protein
LKRQPLLMVKHFTAGGGCVRHESGCSARVRIEQLELSLPVLSAEPAEDESTPATADQQTV